MSRYTPPSRTVPKPSKTVRIPDRLRSHRTRPGWEAAVVTALVDVWPATVAPYLKTTRACIFAARTAIDVLSVFGVHADPLPCAVWVGNDAAKQMLERNVPVEDWPPDAYSVGAHPDLSNDVPGPGFAGHLVVVTDRFLVDLAADQYARPAHNIDIAALMIPVPGHRDLIRVNDTTWVRYQPRPELASWRQSVDWRTSPPVDLHNQLCRRVSDMLTVAAAP